MSKKKGKRYRYQTNTQDLDWQEERADAAQNIGDTQRLVSAIAGVGLVIEGWRRRSLAGGGLAIGGMALLYRAATGYCPAFDAMGIDTRGLQDTSRLGRRKVHSNQATKIKRSIEINRPPSELYRFWRTLDNLPKTPENAAFIEKVRPAVEKYRNIGVRIEDSFLFTDHGLVMLSSKTPRKASDVEKIVGTGR